jgi:hypothetical protein
MTFRKIIRSTTAALAFAATASVGIAHGMTGPECLVASDHMTKVGGTPQAFAGRESVTTPFGTETWPVGHSSADHGTVKVQATLLDGVSGGQTIALDGGPEKLTSGQEARTTPPAAVDMKAGVMLTYWAMPEDGRIRMSFVLVGVPDGVHGLAVSMKYGETRTVRMYDTNGKPIARIHLISSAD